jgi:uncharacterized protein YggE
VPLVTVCVGRPTGAGHLGRGLQGLGCGLCVAECPCGALEMVPETIESPLERCPTSESPFNSGPCPLWHCDGSVEHGAHHSPGERSMNIRRRLIALMTTAVAIALASCGSASPVALSTAPPTVAPSASPLPMHTLLVTGTGMVSAPPDKVDIGVGVDAQAAKAPLAMDQANADMGRLLASPKRQGVKPADITTTELSIYRGYNGPYQASESVDVTIHHIAYAGTVIAAAVNAVGNDATVSGVSYSILDPSTEIAAAR